MSLRHVALAGLLALAGLPSASQAQSSPGLVFGQVPTAAQWNSYFSAKQDLLVAGSNTLLGNPTGGVAYPSFLSVPSCSATGQALNWTSNSGFGCITVAVGGGNVNAPGTLTSNALVIGQGGSNVATIATANNSVLATNGSGVPSLTTALPSGLALGTPASVTLTNGAGLPVSGLGAIANGSIVANISGSSASPSANTLSAIIDSALGNVQGDVLYRGASGWTVLAPGSSGNCLQTGGAAANPSWGSCGTGGGAVSSVSNSDSTLTISPTTGAVVASLNTGHANTWTAAQSFNSSDLVLKGSTSGTTTLNAAATAGATTATLPANTGTVAELNLAQTWTANQTFPSASIANSVLANSSITVAGNATSLGGSVTQDQITGLASTGLVKRTGANTLGIAASGTDYAPATSGSSILYGNGSGGFSPVTVGTGLTFTSGTLSASGGSSGALALISTQSTSGTGATLQWTGLTTTYNSYKLIGTGAYCSNGGGRLLIQFGTGSTPTWITGSYSWHGAINYSTLAGAGNASDSGVDVYTGDAGGVQSAPGLVFEATLYGIPGTFGGPSVTGTASGIQTQGGYGAFSGNYTTSSAITAVRLDCTAGSLFGTFSLYSISN